MNRIVLTTATALVLSLTAPAFASDQLALSLDVEPGTYSTSELVALKAARDSDDITTANAILANPGGFGDVDPAVIQAQQLRDAEENGEFAKVNFLKSGDNDVTMSTKSGTSAGRDQLAASLGVDAADYSLAELVRIKSLQDD